MFQSSDTMETIHKSINWCIDKQNVAYPYTEMLLRNKQEQTLIHAATWLNLKNITVSERCQTHMDQTV